MAAPLNLKIQDLVARLNRDPESRIFLQLAEEYRKAGHLEEALLVCKGGLKKHPGYHSARVALGRIFLALNRLEEARSEFEAVVRAAPENLLANRMLGDVLALAGDAAGARERYRAVLSLGPAEPELKSKIEALQRGEDPRQVGRWGNDLPVAPAAPPQAAARSASSQPAAPAARAAAPVAPAPAPASPAAPGAGRAPAAAEPPIPGRDQQAFRRVLPATPPQAAPQRPNAAPPPPSVQMPASVRIQRDSMSTNTLAELYVRQGFVERAIDVYRRILAVEPHNTEAKRRLQELAPVPPVSTGAPEPARAPARAPGLALAAGAEGGERAAAIGRLRRWLGAIQSRSR